MGISYRTPSPIRQTFYDAIGELKYRSSKLCLIDTGIVEHEVTSRSKSNLDPPLVLKTPQSSPGLPPTTPVTPNSSTLQPTNSFGLLTPGTLDFTSHETHSQSSARREAVSSYGTTKLSSIAEDAAAEVKDGSSCYLISMPLKHRSTKSFKTVLMMTRVRKQINPCILISTRCNSISAMRRLQLSLL
jgi:hypothetical protein